MGMEGKGKEAGVRHREGKLGGPPVRVRSTFWVHTLAGKDPIPESTSEMLREAGLHKAGLAESTLTELPS